MSADRLDFETFTLVYLRNAEADFEVELTINKGRTEPYAPGDGYGHLAVVVADLESEHRRFEAAGWARAGSSISTMMGAGSPAFSSSPIRTAIKIEVLERQGRFR